MENLYIILMIVSSPLAIFFLIANLSGRVFFKICFKLFAVICLSTNFIILLKLCKLL